MTNRRKIVATSPRAWRARQRALLAQPYERRLRWDTRAKQAFRKFRTAGATTDDIDEMVDTFAAIPFVWYVLHRETQREWRARHRSLAQELIAVADRLEQDPDARHLELVDVLLRYAHLLWHRPELVSSVPVAADRKESLERFAFRFVLNYLREAMPRGGISRRPMKEVALIVSALLDRPIKANAFQNDAVLEQIWPRKRYMTEGRITGK